MSSSDPDSITSQTTGAGGSAIIGIVLGILAGVFVILALLSIFLCKNRGEGNPDNLEAGKRNRLASILKLDSVAPSRAYGKDQEEPKSEPRSSRSYDKVIVCVICLDILQGDDMVRHLPCYHYFHSSCLDEWYLRQHHTCPLCKVPFFKESQKKETKGAEPSSRAPNSRSR